MTARLTGWPAILPRGIRQGFAGPRLGPRLTRQKFEWSEAHDLCIIFVGRVPEFLNTGTVIQLDVPKKFKDKIRSRRVSEGRKV